MGEENLRRALIVSDFRPFNRAVDPNLPLRGVLEQIFNCTRYVRVLFLKERGANLIGESVPVRFCSVVSTGSTVTHGFQRVLTLSEYFEEPERE